MEMTSERQLAIYRTMYTVQQWEQQLLQFLDEGKVSGFYHAGRGHEATEVGAVFVLRDDDYLLYDHRGCGHLIAKGMDLVTLYGDFLANELGSTRGLGAGIVHIADPKRGVLGQSGTLGGGHVLGAGAGLSIQLRETTQVVITFFGDGAANRGTFHEAANAAGAWKLPVIFVVQNNGWAISGAVDDMRGGPSFVERAKGYGMEGVVVDGNDPFAVFDVTAQAAQRARSGQGPTLIEAKQARFRGHFEGDPDRYRSDSERSDARANDPIPYTRQWLIDQGLAADSDLSQVEENVNDQVRHAADTALTGRMPGRSRMAEGAYA